MRRQSYPMGVSRPGLALVLPFALLLASAGCGKDEATPSAAKTGGPPAPDSVAVPAKTAAAPAAPAASAPAATAGGAGCKHAACADNFFADTQAPSDCAVGSTCDLAVKLTATGDFHVNDEYPYRFKANDVPGIDY